MLFSEKLLQRGPAKLEATDGLLFDSRKYGVSGAQVGPLPLAPGSFIQPMYQDGQIPYVKRPPNDLPEAVALVRPALCEHEVLDSVWSRVVIDETSRNPWGRACAILSQVLTSHLRAEVKEELWK